MLRYISLGFEGIQDRNDKGEDTMMRYNTVVSYNFTVEHDGEEPTEEEVLGGFVEELMLLGLKTNSLTPLPKAKKHHFEITDDVIVILEEGA